jgi:hypothetical protein
MELRPCFDHGDMQRTKHVHPPAAKCKLMQLSFGQIILYFEFYTSFGQILINLFKHNVIGGFEKLVHQVLFFIFLYRCIEQYDA